MTWVRIDDRAWCHPKFAGVSGNAVKLWLWALCWCNQHERDGFVPVSMLARLEGKRAQVSELLAAGLWEPAEGGWKVHDYLRYQPSREQLDSHREANRVRQERYRAANGQFRNAVTNAVTNSVGDTGRNASVLSTPTQPVPSRPVTDPPVVPLAGDASAKVAARIRKKPRTDMPEGLTPSEKHRAKAVAVGVNCDGEFEKFRAWVQANGKQFADWPAAFTNWLLNANNFKRNGSRQDPVNAPLSLPQQAEVDRILRRVGR